MENKNLYPQLFQLLSFSINFIKEAIHRPQKEILIKFHLAISDYFTVFDKPNRRSEIVADDNNNFRFISELSCQLLTLVRPDSWYVGAANDWAPWESHNWLLGAGFYSSLIATANGITLDFVHFFSGWETEFP